MFSYHAVAQECTAKNAQPLMFNSDQESLVRDYLIKNNIPAVVLCIQLDEQSGAIQWLDGTPAPINMQFHPKLNSWLHFFRYLPAEDIMRTLPATFNEARYKVHADQAGEVVSPFRLFPNSIPDADVPNVQLPPVICLSNEDSASSDFSSIKIEAEKFLQQNHHVINSIQDELLDLSQESERVLGTQNTCVSDRVEVSIGQIPDFENINLDDPSPEEISRLQDDWKKWTNKVLSLPKLLHKLRQRLEDPVIEDDFFERLSNGGKSEALALIGAVSTFVMIIIQLGLLASGKFRKWLIKTLRRMDNLREAENVEITTTHRPPLPSLNSPAAPLMLQYQPDVMTQVPPRTVNYYISHSGQMPRQYRDIFNAPNNDHEIRPMLTTETNL